MKLLPTLVFLGSGVIGFGGWYGFSGLRPKNLQQYLEWQGFELASKIEVNIWKSILYEHRETVKLRTGKDDPTEQDIQDWCFTNLYVQDYDALKDDASKICVNNPQTVRAKIIQQYGNINSLIEANDSKDEKYRVSYIFRKHISEVLTLINFAPPEQEEGQAIKEDIEGGGKALEAWCKKSLNEKPDDSLVDNVRMLCSPKKFIDIQGLIKEQNEEHLLLTDKENVKELDEKYKAINQLDSWKNDDSKEDDSYILDPSILKRWCEKHKEKRFSEEGVFSNVYPKFRFRCLKSRINQI